jgi:hypothetical protein
MSENHGVQNHEQQVPAVGDEAEAIVVGEAAPAELAPGLTRGRSVLIRWHLAQRSARLGAEPSETPGDESTIDQGVFFLREPPGGDATPGYSASVAKRLSQSDDALATALPFVLRRALPNPWLRAALVVTCRRSESSGVVEAKYCVADACAPVTNAHTICDELRQALDR